MYEIEKCLVCLDLCISIKIFTNLGQQFLPRIGALERLRICFYRYKISVKCLQIFRTFSKLVLEKSIPCRLMNNNLSSQKWKLQAQLLSSNISEALDFDSFSPIALHSPWARFLEKLMEKRIGQTFQIGTFLTGI